MAASAEMPMPHASEPVAELNRTSDATPDADQNRLRKSEEHCDQEQLA